MLLKDKRVDKTLLNQRCWDAELQSYFFICFLDSLRFIWRCAFGYTVLFSRSLVFALDLWCVAVFYT